MNKFGSKSSFVVQLFVTELHFPKKQYHKWQLDFQVSLQTCI